jgi:hypothetical protein
VLVGGSLVLRPFTSLAALLLFVIVSLALLAIGEWSAHPESPDRRTARAKAIVWFAAAVALLLWPGLGIHALAVLVGLALVVDGVLGVFGVLGTRRRARARRRTDRGASARSRGADPGRPGPGLARGHPARGVVTLLVVSVLFGLRVVWFGFVTTWAGSRAPRRSSPTCGAGPGPGSRGRPPPGPRADGATLPQVWSIRSENSVLSICSRDSVLSIGSSQSFASVASVWSFASAGSIGSAMSAASLLSYQSAGSALSHQSSGSVLSSQADNAVRGRRTDGPLPRGLVAAGVLACAAALLWHAARRSSVLAS